MKIISQWHFEDNWGISLLSVFRTSRFAGFVIFGFLFEWELRFKLDPRRMVRPGDEPLA